MSKCIFAIIAFLLFAEIATVAFAKEQYLCDLLNKKAYRAAWNALLTAEKGVDDWVIGYGKNCDGPTSPNDTVTIEGGTYQLATFCKTHDCAGNYFLIIFSPDANRAWALLITEKTRWLGNPSPPIRAALTKAASEKWSTNVPSTTNVPPKTATPIKDVVRSPLKLEFKSWKRDAFGGVMIATFVTHNESDRDPGSVTPI